jgi:ABC-type sugar transport system ATPase subunit
MIIVSRVSKYFGDKLIFKDVSFELEQGQGIFIFGPNGCGKSTLLKIIAGILMPSKGEVTFKGIKKIGYICRNNFGC